MPSQPAPDDPELGRYIEFNFTSLLTDLEGRVSSAILMEDKAASSESPACLPWAG